MAMDSRKQKEKWNIKLYNKRTVEQKYCMCGIDICKGRCCKTCPLEEQKCSYICQSKREDCPFEMSFETYMWRLLFGTTEEET